MILVDTSVWVDHLRRADAGLAGLLVEGEVLGHRLVVEELSCGRLLNRAELLELLGALPRAPEAEHGEFLDFVSRHGLAGSGLGVVDVHLLASARLSRAALWTRDRALRRAAERLGAAHPAA